MIKIIEDKATSSSVINLCLAITKIGSLIYTVGIVSGQDRGFSSDLVGNMNKNVNKQTSCLTRRDIEA